MKKAMLIIWIASMARAYLFLLQLDVDVLLFLVMQVNARRVLQHCIATITDKI